MNKKANSNHVLLLSSRYGVSNSANAICAKNIADEMIKRGYIVTVITSSGEDKDIYENIDGVEVYELKQAFYTSLIKRKEKQNSVGFNLLFKIISILRHVLNLFLFPNTSPLRSRRVYRLTKKLIVEKNIGVLLSTYRPFESSYTALKIKQEFLNNITVVDFQLDVLSEPNFGNNWIKKYLAKKATAVTKKEICILDKVILPESERHSSKYSTALFSEFPVYIPNSEDCRCDFEFDYSSVHAAYIGSIDKENRNPQYMIELVKKYNTLYSPKIMIDIWGNIEKDVLDSIRKEKCVTYRGMVEHRFVNDILRKADFVINIANRKTTHMIPSKIFQEFASRRPIINFMKSEDDCSIPYFKKYGYVIFCNERYDIDSYVKVFNEQINRYLNIKIEQPNELLEKCTPEYFVNLMETIIDD